jgi:outer membrane autotransporter protein
MWAEGLGEFIHQDAESENPSYFSGTGGLLLGFDYYGNREGLLGVAICYARNHIHQGQHAGKDSIDFYAATAYGAAYLGKGYVEFGLAGAVNKFYNKRHVQFAGFDATAKSSHWGIQAVPHAAAGYDFNFDWGTLEPFVSMDCDFLFQQAFSEHGAGALNMHQRSSWAALLRSEIGLHAYEVWNTRVGDFVLRETLSYVNKEPFHVGYIQANILGFSPPGFTVNSFTNNQSFIAPGVQLFYRAHNGIFSSISYMGEFQGGDGRYMSNNILAKIGAYF